jgi:hypothetical protein
VKTAQAPPTTAIAIGTIQPLKIIARSQRHIFLYDVAERSIDRHVEIGSSRRRPTSLQGLFRCYYHTGDPSLHGSVGFVLEQSALRGPYAGSRRPTILVLLPGPSNPVPGGRRHLAPVLRFCSGPKPGRRPADATAVLVRRGMCPEHVSGRDRVRAAEPPCPRIEPRRAGAGPSHRQT